MSGTFLTPLSAALDFGTLGNATTSTVWENMRGASATVTLGGTFGGATVVIEGSDVVGGPYATLIGEAGAASYTAAGVAQIPILPRFWRVRSSGGTGTAVTALATLYLSPLNNTLGGTSLEAITNGNLVAPPVAGAVNEAQIQGSATGAPGRVVISAVGSDTNISMVLSPKGTGGLLANAPDSAASGGNARGTNAVDWQTSRGLAVHVANGTSATIGGGSNNTAGGTAGTVAGGNAGSAAGSFSTVAGGNSNSATATGGWVPGGQQATTRGLLNVGAWSAGQLAAQGDAQAEEHVLRRQTTDATATRLTADNAVAGTANTINLANFSLVAGRLIVEGRAASGANLGAAWFVDISAFRDNGAGTVAMMGGGGTSITPTHSRGTGSAWRIDITADTTNGGIAVTVTGALATTINWVARFIAVQVQTAS